MYIKFSELKAHMSGKWEQCIRDLAPQLSDALDRAPRHGPCPVFGGEDNFRFMKDFRETGAAHSNRLGDTELTKNGVFRNGINVLRYYNNWTNDEVCRALCNWLGIDSDAPEGAKMPVAKPPPKVESKPQWNEFAIEKMTEWWKKSVGLETSDLVISYLASRKLAAVDLPHRGVMRFHPELYYFDKGLMEKPIFIPALLAYIQDPDGDGVGLHRTFIKADGKADVKEPRKLMTPIRRGGYTGAAVRLYEPANGHIGLSEGLETAFAVRLGTDQPLWSTLNRGMLEVVELPSEIKYVDIWADNDPEGDGQESALKAAKRLKEEGRFVMIHIPKKPGTDWADVWREQGEKGFPTKTAANAQRKDGKTWSFRSQYCFS